MTRRFTQKTVIIGPGWMKLSQVADLVRVKKITPPLPPGAGLYLNVDDQTWIPLSESKMCRLIFPTIAMPATELFLHIVDVQPHNTTEVVLELTDVSAQAAKYYRQNNNTYSFCGFVTNGVCASLDRSVFKDH